MNGKPWDPRDVYLLYGYAEKISQQEAARRLGRSLLALCQKVQDLGIKWRQGYTNYTQIAKRVGCSQQTVKRLVDILYPDGVPSYGEPGTSSYRPLIDFDMEARIVRILLANQKIRQRHIRAGKASAAARKAKANAARQTEEAVGNQS